MTKRRARERSAARADRLSLRRLPPSLLRAAADQVDAASTETVSGLGADEAHNHDPEDPQNDPFDVVDDR